jgi:hypothetical protein
VPESTLLPDVDRIFRGIGATLLRDMRPAFSQRNPLGHILVRSSKDDLTGSKLPRLRMVEWNVLRTTVGLSVGLSVP